MVASKADHSTRDSGALCQLFFGQRESKACIEESLPTFGVLAVPGAATFYCKKSYNLCVSLFLIYDVKLQLNQDMDPRRKHKAAARP
jgi:hypothetical protein